MKLVLIQASSLDGTTNQGKSEDHHSWVSKEDQKHFMEILNKSALVIMGSRTYKAAKEFMVHIDGRIRIVMTRNPEEYNGDKIPGKLEFTNEDPKELLKRFEKKGIKEALLVGGAYTNTKFLKEKLVTEILQTIEPKLVGTGIATAIEKINIDLELVSVEKLNAKGTLLLKYKVL